MDFLFYHSAAPEIPAHFRGKKIWLPANEYAPALIRHILAGKKEHANVLVEENLAQFFPAQTEFRCTIVKNGTASSRTSKKIVLYAQSDTLANSVAVMAEHLNDHQLFFSVPGRAAERADIFFRSHNIPFGPYSFKWLKKVRPDVLLLLNDWSKEPQRIIAHCRWLGIPVICLQESVIDFGDRFRRMLWADHVLVQGAQTVRDLDRETYFVTGNPRYENIPPAGERGNEALINCNFTYGIFEDQRYGWLDDIHDTLAAEGLDYAISQHPRDTGDLKKYNKVLPSSSARVHGQLENAAFLVTRFSSLIHEALVMGVPVIYYNPHGETMQYDFGFNGRFIFLATTREELRDAVQRLRSVQWSPEELEEYLAIHCLPRHPVPSANIDHLLAFHHFRPGSFGIADLLKLVLYYPHIKTLLSRLRKIVMKAG